MNLQDRAHSAMRESMPNKPVLAIEEEDSQDDGVRIKPTILTSNKDVQLQPVNLSYRPNTAVKSGANVI